MDREAVKKFLYHLDINATDSLDSGEDPREILHEELAIWAGGVPSLWEDVEAGLADPADVYEAVDFFISMLSHVVGKWEIVWRDLFAELLHAQTYDEAYSAFKVYVDTDDLVEPKIVH